jgi:hypothetical protein
MLREKFEELVRQAIRSASDSLPSEELLSNCLSDEVLDGIYRGTLSEDQCRAAVEHLSLCRQCRTEVEVYFELMEQTSKSDVIDSEVEVLDKIKALLSLPLKSPSSWDKLKELCNQLVNTLTRFDASHLQGKKRLSLVTKGYEYTAPSSEKKKDEDKTKESQEQLEIGERMLLLQEILGDEEISLSKRIALSEELLLYANKKSRELKSSPSLKNKKPHEKKDNNSS